MRRILRDSALLVSLALLGCDDGAPTDAGLDAGAPEPDAAVPPAPVVEPRRPAFDCPAGWEEVLSAASGTRLVGCDPWPESGPADCAADAYQLPGGGGCVPVGSSCPSGGYAAPPVGATVRYVAAGGGPGDGSLASPHGTIAEALAAGASGDVLLLSVGEHAGVELTRDVTLVGACASGTSLTASGGPALRVTAGATIARDLALPQAEVGPGAHLVLEDATLEGDGPTLRIDGADARATLRRARVRGLDAGTVVFARGAAIVSLEAVELRGGGRAIDAADRAEVSVTDSVVGAGADAGQPTDGIYLASGARLTATRVALDRLTRFGVQVDGAGTEATVDHAWIEFVTFGGESGVSVAAVGGASARVTRSSVIDSERTGLAAIGEGSSLVFEDSAIDGVLGTDDAQGHGAFATEGATLTLRRAAILGAEHLGVVASDGGAVRVEDVEVLETVGDVIEGDLGWGLVMLPGSRLEVTRVLVENTHQAGVLASGPGAVGVFEDLDVRRTRRSGDGQGAGIGLVLMGGAEVSVQRARLAENADMSVQVFDPGSVLVMEDARIEQTLPAGCIDDACRAIVGGIGLGVYGGGRAELERFVVSRHESVGLQVAFGSPDGETRYPDPGVLVLRGGLVSQNPTGLNVQSPGFDYAQLDTVRFMDNGENVSATEAPVPRPPPMP